MKRRSPFLLIISSQEELDTENLSILRISLLTEIYIKIFNIHSRLLLHLSNIDYIFEYLFRIAKTSKQRISREKNGQGMVRTCFPTKTTKRRNEQSKVFNGFDAMGLARARAQLVRPMRVHACASYPSCGSLACSSRRCTHARTPTNKAAITAANVGGWRGPGHARPAHTGVNYAPREMSNCSPYRKIYNSSRCGKHYVLSHSLPDRRSPSVPILSPSFADWPPCPFAKHTALTSGSHPYRTTARNEKLEILWSSFFFSLFLLRWKLLCRECATTLFNISFEIAFVSWPLLLLANRRWHKETDVISA